jgi:hydroxymethylpyrimidine/phosphomethylpyrimidine kinase
VPSCWQSQSAKRLLADPFTQSPEDPSSAELSAGDSPGEAQITPRVLCFGALDPTGAGGLVGDALAVASAGAMACPVATAILVRDTQSVHEHVAIDPQTIADQAVALAEDMEIDAVKVGFCGCAEGVVAIAEVLSGFDDIAVVLTCPDLSWMDTADIDSYFDAVTELLLPTTTVLVGNYNALWRWLLDEWSIERSPRPRDLAAAAAEHGAAHVLITSMPADEPGHIRLVLASPEQELLTVTHDRLPGQFIGAGDTLAAALAANLASGVDLPDAVREAVGYLCESLLHGHSPGMGAAVPNPLFWAQQSDDEAEGETEDEANDAGIDNKTTAETDTSQLSLWAQMPADATRH